jgi:ABC-2 type transport system ATP-binding protein
MIDLINITKTFDETTALDSLDLHLAAGDMFGYIGPNGAGKSTTMKILACLLEPDEGQAKVGGHDCAVDGDQIRRIVGYMPDFLGVYSDLRVHEYLDFFASAYGQPRKERKRVIADVLELTDLTIKSNAMVDSLSRGMQQRLGVARVLLHDPKVLLLDEPASGLDPRARIEMRGLLIELGKMGKTVMVSSHILSELHEMCNTIGIIEQGRLVFSGTIEHAIHESGLHGQTEIAVDNPSAATNLLLRLEPVEDVQDIGGSRLLVTLEENVTSVRFLAESLTQAGIGIEELRPRRVKLEDVFLRLTKGEVS